MLNNSIVQLLPSDEASADQFNWYEPRSTAIKGFMLGTERWIKEQRTIQDEEDVTPHDSVSVVAQRRRKGKTKAGSSTASSSVVSCTSSVARMKEEAKRAALLAQAESLKKKKVMQLQEANLRAEMEQLELETAIAASTAKLKVFESHESPRDALNEYVAAMLPSTDVHSHIQGGHGSLAESHTNSMRAHPVHEVHSPATSYNYKDQDHIPDTTTKNMEHVPHAYLCHQVPTDRASFDEPQEPMPAGNRIYEVMRHQNMITEMLVKQQDLSLLPKRDIPVFTGDPLTYRSFLRAFENAIDSKTQNARDKLFFLEQYTSREPQELVRSCEHMPPEKGYREARLLLHQQYGDELKIAMAYIEKALKWPQIKAEDARGLNAYALFLIGCKNTMQDVDYMDEMDNPTNMRAVLSKLPYKMRERWKHMAFDLLENRKRRAKFTDLVSFIERQAKIAIDPLFGDLQGASVSVEQKERFTPVKKAKGNTTKSSSFVISIDTDQQNAMQSNQSAKTDQSKSKPETCVYCEKNHTVENCEKLKRQIHKDKIDFLKSKGLCFGCLVQGHLSKDCTRKLTCQICSRKHPSILHVQKDEMASVKEDKKGTSEAQFTSSVKQETCGCTGAGSRECVLAIVPVRLKSKKGTQTVETYAFIDSGSSATFCTEKVMRMLNLRGRKTEILLRTMGQETLVHSHILSDLEVAGLEENKYVDLPSVFTQPEIPVHKENIPQQKDLQRWTYLEEVRLPSINAEIGLLIGANAHKAIEPWQVINSQGDGPYAVRTAIGWTVNGPIRRGEHLQDVDEGLQGFTVNRISVASIEELLTQHFNSDFSERSCEDRTEMSQDDRQFMKEVEQSCQFIDGHYCISLPFKNRSVKMPTNRSHAEQRAINLKKKLDKNSEFHTDYKAFMHDIIARGYAERVPVESQPKEGENERAAEVKDLDLSKDTLPTERALGVQWCTETDTFRFRVNIPERPTTRRGILSVVSSVYDPLGLVAPCILPAKLILRELCQEKLSWDEEINERHSRRWLQWLSEVQELSGFQVDRCIKPVDFGPTVKAQIHNFSDASESGYGTASYILLTSKDGKKCCTLLMCKSRVAPLKKVTVPRMELTAAIIAVKVDKLLRQEMEITLQESVFWTDSLTVLRYIENDASRFKTFVANRVAFIREATLPSQWRYVNSSLNPADVASRGMKFTSLTKHDNWIHGPPFLCEDEPDWPTRPDVHNTMDDDSEIRKTTLVTLVSTTKVAAMTTLVEYYSDWHRLKKAVAWMLRLKDLLHYFANKRKECKAVVAITEADKRKQNLKVQEEMKRLRQSVDKKPLSVEDLENAEIALICHSQMEMYPEEFVSLQGKDAQVKKSSPLYRLDPVLQDGVIRVGGRLSKSAMPEESRFPAVLHKDHHLARLILMHVHRQNGHCGRNHLVAKVRQRYWIPGLNRATRTVISSCITCRKLHAKPAEQKMADLLEERVLPDQPPFTHVGVDYFGPFEVKRARSMVKRYGVLFTCLALRAVHIEVAHSLDTSSCINAIRRFICILPIQLGAGVLEP
ncbi:hypothetical protein SRHO_G00069470 [Serrasalmus rhombeus]